MLAVMAGRNKILDAVHLSGFIGILPRIMRDLMFICLKTAILAHTLVTGDNLIGHVITYVQYVIGKNTPGIVISTDPGHNI
jgi:hypothetical protein